MCHLNHCFKLKRLNEKVALLNGITFARYLSSQSLHIVNQLLRMPDEVDKCNTVIKRICSLKICNFFRGRRSLGNFSADSFRLLPSHPYEINGRICSDTNALMRFLHLSVHSMFSQFVYVPT